MPHYDLTTVNQGAAALTAVDRAHAAGQPFSVVFLDVRMPPGIDGVETAARLWRDHPDLEIVLCSAHNDYSWDDLARALGPTDHLLVLRKPFDAIEVRQLAASLSEKWCRGRRLARQIRELDAAIQAEVEARLAERARHEAELRRRERLEVLGRLAAGLVHEISAPAQLASASLDVLAEIADGLAGCAAGERPQDLAALTADLPSVLDNAQLAIGRIHALVKRMRAQIRQQPEQAFKPSNLDHAIRAALALAEGEYKYCAEVALELAALPPIHCDEADISQAVLNLVINAAHAIRDARGGAGPLGRITISSCTGGSFVEIAVADTGTGIRPEHRDRIFEPFFTTKPIDQGTGQGLAIVHACVVDRHHGSLSFDTEVGRGTIFRIRLPIAGIAASSAGTK
ncbi:MAG: hybrid sensor histidine kinase/response regulator [Deltaproteobacteria bacterium]|nr:MAG: hybrid sensor histidine kinase/response regulator [Deltaproteobacteria bacterium]